MTEDSASIEIYSVDKAAQSFITQTITFDRTGMRMRPHAERWCWPSELDLMAGHAGLRLAERYADWDRRPFTSESTDHISIYRR